MTLYPLAPDRTEWDHMMFIPADRAGETEYWSRSWSLIEEGVFQREDLWVCVPANGIHCLGKAGRCAGRVHSFDLVACRRRAANPMGFA